MELNRNADIISTELDNSRNFIQTIVRASWIAYILSAMFQLIFYHELINTIVTLLIGIGWFVYLKTLMHVHLWRSFTFSSLMIFGFATTQVLLPLLFTTIEGKAVTNNLDYPELVFVHSLAILVVLIITHAIYRFIIKKTPSRSVSLMEKAGFFIPPNDLQLWMIGMVGLFSIFYVYFIAPDVAQSVTGSASDKFIQSLSAFAYAPFLFICGELYNRKSKKIGSNLIPLILFTVGLFGLSIGRNSTGAFMFGFTGLAFSYFVGAITGVFKTKIFTLRNFMIAGVGVWLLVGPLADLRTAMVIVRGDRTEIPAETLLSNTIIAFNDKEAIEERRAYDANTEDTDPNWDERYVDNVFTARFANVKFNDLSLSRVQILGEYDPDMQDYAYQFFIAGLPDPVIKFFNFDIDKEFVNSMSIGDFLYVTSGGDWPAEGFRVGHFAGIGMVTFGWWYLGILGLLMLVVFYLIDKFQQRSKGHSGSDSHSDNSIRYNQRLNYSFCGLLTITNFYQFLQSESVVHIGIFVMRGWLQIALSYLVLFYVSRLLSGEGLKRLKWRSSPA